ASYAGGPLSPALSSSEFRELQPSRAPAADFQSARWSPGCWCATRQVDWRGDQVGQACRGLYPRLFIFDLRSSASICGKWFSVFSVPLCLRGRFWFRTLAIPEPIYLLICVFLRPSAANCFAFPCWMFSFSERLTSLPPALPS